LRHDELLEGIRVPKLSRHARWSYYKVQRAATASADAIGAVVIDEERSFCAAVLSGSKHMPRNLPVLAERLCGPKGGDFASKFELRRATEIVTQNGFVGDP